MLASLRNKTTSPLRPVYSETCTVEPVLKDQPMAIGHTNVVFQDRWSLPTGSITWKCRTMWSFKTGGLLLQWSLRTGFTVYKDRPRPLYTGGRAATIHLRDDTIRITIPIPRYDMYHDLAISQTRQTVWLLSTCHTFLLSKCTGKAKCCQTQDLTADGGLCSLTDFDFSPRLFHGWLESQCECINGFPRVH